MTSYLSWHRGDCKSGTAIVMTSNLDRNQIIRSRLSKTLDDLLRDINAWSEDYVSLGRELVSRARGETKLHVYVERLLGAPALSVPVSQPASMADI